MRFFNKIHWPNIITISRGLAALLMLGAFVESWPWWQLCLIFNLGAITDWLDGWMARRLAAESDFGKVFDPTMDKLLTWSGFILLSLAYPVWWLITTSILLIVREILTDYWRWTLYAHGHVMAAIFTAKLKTTLQIILINSIFLLLITDWLLFEWLAMLVAIGAISASWFSAIVYGKNFYRLMSNSSK